LHDLFVRTDRLEANPLWRTFEEFDASEAKWLPYWDNAGCVKVASDPAGKSWDSGALASLYLHPDKRALLVISNVQSKPATVRTRLFFKELGLPGTAEARDVERNLPIAVSDGVITLKLKGYDYRLVWVE
jgi:hypothetical protein